MPGFVRISRGLEESDQVVLERTKTNARGSGLTTVTANTVGLLGEWPNTELTVTWQNSLIKADSIISVTSGAPGARVRQSFAAQAEGSVEITRSSGTVADEPFVAIVEIQ